jgi:predicted transcriptional regulator
LTEVGRPNPPEVPLTPTVSVRQSVRHDIVICLDCGYRGKTLRRHISVRHGLTGDEYRHRWGLRSDHPLTAPAYSEQRSTLAKERGLGRKSATSAVPVETQVEPEALVTPEPDPQAVSPRRPRSRPNRTDVSAAEAPPSTRKKRSRSRVASVGTERGPIHPENTERELGNALSQGG